MNNVKQMTPSESLREAIKDNVRRWRIAHQLPVTPQKFRNEPRILKASRKSVVIDVEVRVEDQGVAK